MATAQPAMNPAYLLDPSLYGDQQAVSQQQALAQALMSQGMSPMGDTQMAGQVALRNSPTQSIAKLVQILSGQDMQRQANLGGQALMQRQAQAVMPMFQDQTSGLPPQQAALAAGGQGPTQAAAQSAQTMPGQTVRPGPWTIPGSTGQQSLSAYLLNPEKFGETFAGGLAPNDTTKMAMQGGMDPAAANRLALQKSQMDPKIFAMKQAGMSDAQINAAVLGEAAKNAEISRRPKEAFSNMVTGEAGMVGQIPEGANVIGAPGPNGQVSLSPMPGVQQVMTGNAAATGAGTAQNDMVEYTMPDGSKQNMTRAQAVAWSNGQNNPAQFDLAPGTNLAALRAQLVKEGDPASLAAFDAKYGNKMPGFGTGQSTTDAKIQKAGGDVISQAPQMVAQSKGAIGGLESALNIVEGGIKTGQGTGKTMSAIAFLNNMGIPVLRGDVTGYQTLQKYLQNSLNAAAAGSSAGGSDNRFDSFMHGQPNADTMTGKPLAGAIRYVLSQHDATVARGEFLQQAYANAKAAGDPNASLTAQQKWNGAYNPQFFNFNRMAPDDQAAFLKSPSVDKYGGAAGFVKQYNQYAAQTGWVH